MAIERKKFSTQADPDILTAFKKLAEKEGRQFQMVLEEAMLDYLEKKLGKVPRDSVMAHFQASLEKNRRLGELLAK